ncbi:MAG: biopolymer transporter ExbD [Pedobacter sp.]|nr:MAG: biopolymer transporter ExbD [Pedobacter sp.]
MTAMCDVAFLLLTFFILTATSRQADPLEVKIPSSTVKFKVPDKDISILTIGKGKVFYEIIGQDVKARTLELMGEQYGIKFTPEEVARFKVIPSFGVSIGNLKQYIMLDGEARKKSGLDAGIPTADTTRNGELSRWIYQSRTAVKQLHDAQMRISIKGDANEEYPMVRKIIAIMQEQDLNKFSLITTPEGDVK